MEITTLSLGAGWQSTAMALMLEERALPHPVPDLAVFADTRSEPDHVYETLDYIERHVSFPIVRASRGNLEEQTFRQARGQQADSYLEIPIFGHTGIGQRRCTHDYKIGVIRKAIREWAGVNPPALQVTQYLGISLDEIERARDSRVAYIVNQYPLLDVRMNRQDCIEWMRHHHPQAPVGKSACYFCPYHSVEQWRELRQRYPQLYERAVVLDGLLMARGFSLTRPDRQGRHHGLEATLDDSDLQGRLDLGEGFGNECEGMCGV